MPNGSDLSPEHDWGKEGKEEPFKHEEEEEYHGGGRRVGRALVKLWPHARDAMVDGQEQGVKRHRSDVKLKKEHSFILEACHQSKAMFFTPSYREQDEIFLVVFSDAIVDPGKQESLDF